MAPEGGREKETAVVFYKEYNMNAERERIAGKVQEWYEKRTEQEASGWGSSKEDVLLLLKAVLCTVDVEKLKTNGYGPLHYIADAEKSREMRCSEVKGTRMLEAVKLLKECGLNVNTKRSSEDEFVALGETALHEAAWKGNFDLVKGLVEAGANVNMKCDAGRTPLSLAAPAGQPMIVWYLLKHGAKWEESYALHWAATYGRPVCVKMLLKAGANLSEKDEDGDMPAQCCFKGLEGRGGSPTERAEALSMLLKNGADVQVKDEDGNNLLHLAVSHGNEQCIPILVGRGLQVDATNGTLNTPLHLASNNGHLGCVRELIRRGAPLDAVNSYGSTPLLLAVGKSHVKVVTELIDADASVHIKDKNSITALHIAAALGSMELVYSLVEADASVDALTDDGESPLVSCMRPSQGNVSGKRKTRRKSPGKSEARGQVARFLLKMGAAVDERTIAVAGKVGFGGVIASFLRNEREERNAVKDRLDTVSTHYLSTMSGAADEKDDTTVRVRLVHKGSGERGEKEYALSIPLMERLAARVTGGQEERAKTSAGRSASAAGILPNMLDPRKHGYKGDEEDEGEGGGKKEAKSVELEYDGVDFTEQGFEAVVKFVTTGSVEELLARRPVEGRASSSDSSTGGAGAASSTDTKKRERVKLFDDVRAKQALQAAEFFCLEGMAREVKTLMGEYGFDLVQNENGREAQEPSRKRARAAS